MAHHQSADSLWECIKDLFPSPKFVGRPPTDCRQAFIAIFWMLRSGSTCRDLQEENGTWRTIYGLYDKWNGDGTLDAIRGRLRTAHIDGDVIDNDLWCIDGAITRAERCASGGGEKSNPDEPTDHALGRSRGGFSTKIHLLVSGFGHS